MVATYALEIVEASRCLQASSTLKGDAAVKTVADNTWEVSVRSTVALLSFLTQMNIHLDWTQKLGDALIGQQQDVVYLSSQFASAPSSMPRAKEQPTGARV